jgi:glycolate oxidase FAD binding subunit
LAGSYGTLAVMTELTMKVVPRPEASVSVVRCGLSDAEGSRLMIDALNAGYEVSAAAHLPPQVAPHGQALTLLRLEGSAASVEARQTALRCELKGDVLQEHESTPHWAAIRNLTPLSRSAGCLWRLSIPPARASTVVKTIAESLACRWFYDWGGALVWLRVEASIGDDGASVIHAAVGTS